LGAHEIGTEIYYPLPLHLQECFRPLGFTEGSFPESERAAQQVLALPVYPELNPAAISLVAQTISSFVGSASLLAAN
jgi:dTDP-4-amino-4,6-dideoxygalactose transaminase